MNGWMHRSGVNLVDFIEWAMYLHVQNACYDNQKPILPFHPGAVEVPVGQVAGEEGAFCCPLIYVRELIDLRIKNNQREHRIH